MKDESEIAVAAAFEAKAAVYLGPAKTVNQIADSKETFYPFVLWQFTQAADDGGVDGKKFTQASS